MPFRLATHTALSLTRGGGQQYNAREAVKVRSIICSMTMGGSIPIGEGGLEAPKAQCKVALDWIVIIKGTCERTEHLYKITNVTSASACRLLMRPFQITTTKANVLWMAGLCIGSTAQERTYKVISLID
ncbi:uncharacterized protein LOC134218345 [Armigeres subalbatus]|uniref:uncharacterized protein LOC134218345 n=1 Tax=Armigeres subalbatus TaxID=124917 RepID=UPI002ED68B40